MDYLVYETLKRAMMQIRNFASVVALCNSCAQEPVLQQNCCCSFSSHLETKELSEDLTTDMCKALVTQCTFKSGCQNNFIITMNTINCENIRITN